jgi:hypothetical protein
MDTEMFVYGCIRLFTGDVSATEGIAQAEVWPQYKP